MNDSLVYRVELCGEADEDEINAISPLRVSIDLSDAGSSLLTVCTDQSGLIGLMRHLHGLGYVFLSVKRVERA
jgi:hypothetical protein